MRIDQAKKIMQDLVDQMMQVGTTAEIKAFLGLDPPNLPKSTRQKHLDSWYELVDAFDALGMNKARLKLEKILAQFPG